MAVNETRAASERKTRFLLEIVGAMAGRRSVLFFEGRCRGSAGMKGILAIRFGRLSTRRRG